MRKRLISIPISILKLYSKYIQKWPHTGQMAAALKRIFWGKIYHLNHHEWLFWPGILILISILDSIRASNGQKWCKKCNNAYFLPYRSGETKWSRSWSWCKDWLTDHNLRSCPLYCHVFSFCRIVTKVDFDSKPSSPLPLSLLQRYESHPMGGY